MKQNYINIFIGIILVFLGLKLHDSNTKIWEYLGLIMLVYGVFVIFIKSIKIILSYKDKYKKINAFEEKNKREIPSFIRKLLEYQIKAGKEIEFEIPHYGRFQIIDFNIDQGDNFSNPYHILKEIDWHIEKNLFPVVNYSKIIPFAINHNYTVLFIEKGKEDIILIDLNSEESKPFALQYKIDHYINIDKLESRDDKYYYNGLKKVEEILSENEYFFDVPDCIFGGSDYLETLDKSFSLLEKKPNFVISNIEETKDSYILNLTIEGKSKRMELQRYSDYRDSEGFIKSLNEILLLLNYDQKKYYPISMNVCDFGILLADDKNYKILLSNGCVDLNEEEYKLTDDEINQIRKYDDLNREIENIEFHLKVTKKNNKIEKNLTYNYHYQTNYEFDSDGLIELKKRLKVHPKKVDDGYEIYFVK